MVFDIKQQSLFFDMNDSLVAGKQVINDTIIWRKASLSSLNSIDKQISLTAVVTSGLFSFSTLNSIHEYNWYNICAHIHNLLLYIE